MIALAQRFFERTVFVADSLDVELFADDQLHLRHGERLEHVIAGSSFHGLDRGFDRSVGRHHDHGRGGVDALGFLQEIEAVHARQLEIGDNQVGRLAGQAFERGFSVPHAAHIVAVFAEADLQQPAHLGLVFDDQNGSHV